MASRVVFMFIGICPNCGEDASPAPRATEALAADDVRAHVNIIHEGATS